LPHEEADQVDHATDEGPADEEREDEEQDPSGEASSPHGRDEASEQRLPVQATGVQREEAEQHAEDPIEEQSDFVRVEALARADLPDQIVPNERQRPWT